MNRFLIFLLISAWIFTSCKKPEVKIPEGVLKKEQMVPILADVHVAQASAVMNSASDTTRYSLPKMMKYILEIHHTSPAQYDSSIAFYAKHPEIMSQIYDSVITELSKKQGGIEGSTINKPPSGYGR
jgi:hypothetical protein